MKVTMSFRIQRTLIILMALCVSGDAATAVLKSGPYIHFERKGQVTVHWQTEEAVPSVLEYGTHSNLGTYLREDETKTDHAVTLTVKPDALYSCRIHVGNAATKAFQFDSTFEYGRDPISNDATPYARDEWTQIYEKAADFIVSRCGE